MKAAPPGPGPARNAPVPEIRIGTSGWHYDHWRGPFYPWEMRAADFLGFYQRFFDTVEINNSFYRLPSVRAFQEWRDSSPPGFLYAVKGSRFITHLKKLKDPESSLALLLERVQFLGDRLGPILFQLPPRWPFNEGRLAAFLAALPRQFRFALEFRDPSWINARALELLRAHGVAFCIYEFAGFLAPREVTADFVYIRLHGPKGAYQGRYDRGTLADWAQAITAWQDQGLGVFCYFDNDEAGYAVQNALELKALVKS